jgi:polyisoprenoid-binding protein YceI
MSTIEITPTKVAAGSYNADPAHSHVEFGIRHMKISTIHGRFLTYEARLEGGEQPRISGSISTDSAVTDDEQRDAHIKGADFFDVERYPQATFQGTLVAPDRVEGEVTLKGVTKPVTLSAKVTGPDNDPWGNERVGIELEGEVNRLDHGVNWNAPLPGGGFLLDDTVKLSASLSFVKEA